jgi:hypothetical protein
MPVSYEEYWAKSIECAINLVADGATFTALTNPTTPKALIVEIDGGAEDEASPTIRACTGATFIRTVALWAHVCPDPLEMQHLWNAPQTITAEGMIPVAFYWRPSGITYRHELLRYVLSKTGLIMRDIANQQGAAGKWRKILPQFGGMQFMDVAGYARGVIRSQINIQFGDLP